MVKTWRCLIKFLGFLSITANVYAAFTGLPPQGDGTINDWACMKSDGGAICLAVGSRQDANNNPHAFLLTSLDGIHWSEQKIKNLPDISTLSKVSCDENTDICIATGIVGSTPILVQSIDHLNTWAFKPLPATERNIHYIDAISCRSGFCVVFGNEFEGGEGNPMIFQTQNRGKAWQLYDHYRIIGDSYRGGCTGRGDTVTCIFYGIYFDPGRGTTNEITASTGNRGQSWSI
jgi:hypothetical protein